MKTIATHSDRDFFSDVIITDLHKTRIVGRVILIDSDNNIALVGKEHLLLPGGGIEEGESVTDGMIRECLEEAGCTVEIIGDLGKTVDHRYKINGIQETYCSIARVRGEKGQPTTQQKDEIGIRVEWMTPDQATQIFDEQFSKLTDKNYHAYFNLKSCMLFLEEYRKHKEKALQH